MDYAASYAAQLARLEASFQRKQSMAGERQEPSPTKGDLPAHYRMDRKKDKLGEKGAEFKPDIIMERERDRGKALEKDGYVMVDITEGLKDLSVSHDVSVKSTQDWLEQVLQDPKNRLAMSAFTMNPATSIVSSGSRLVADTQTFNISIPMEGAPITNQRASGRCWLFASTNVFRIALMKKHNLKEFQLSQAYLFFYDQLEKSNYFLESIIDTANEPIDGRLLSSLLAAPVGDGGQWDMAANLVAKYGLVPQRLYPDSYNAMNSASLGGLLCTKLREDALKLRHLASSGHSTSTTLSSVKQDMLRDVHRILTLMLGPPPAPDKEFEWEHNDADGKYKKLVTTPRKFAQELSDPRTVRACGGTDVHRLFSLVNDPRNDYEKLLTVDRLGNVYSGRPVTYVNARSSVLKEAAVAQLKAGIPVFFGCDVGKSSDTVTGIMDPKLHDFELGFDIKLGLTKADRLRTNESQMTHAMVLTAVHVEDGKSVRWRVENSWDTTAGDKGYFLMTDDWFDEFVYQVVVDPEFVSKSIRDVLKTKPKVLPLWDPMGALA